MTSSPTDKPHYVITVGRQFGSGGRELGRRLADHLGIKYYDKELLKEAARKSGLNHEFFERSDERFPSFLSGLFSFALGYNSFNLYQGSSTISDESIYKAQSDFIHELADTEPCVIVGRSADYILRDRDNVVNIFVHAPADACARRVMERAERGTEQEAKALAEKTNKLRANFYNFYTDKRWGDARSYDLTLDSSLMPLEDIADFVIAYVRKRLG